MNTNHTPWYGKIIILIAAVVAITILSIFTNTIWFSFVGIVFIFALASTILTNPNTQKEK